MISAMPTAGTGRIEAWTRSNPCLVCGGHPSLPQGKGLRCYGFLSGGGQMAHCTREEHRGALDYYRTKTGETLNTFGHWLAGDCRCGLRHGAAPPVDTIRSQRAARDDQPRLWNVPDSHVEMVHRYERAGVLLWEYCRFWKHFRAEHGGAKGFPRHVGEDGRWYLGQGPWKGQQKPLYRQDEAVHELQMGGKIFVVEGERDADAIWDVGCIAVCNPDGAGSFREHQAATLIAAMREGAPSAEITIVGDDDETGVPAALRTYRMLAVDSELKQRIEVVLPPVGCKDVAEFVTQKGRGVGDG